MLIAAMPLAQQMMRDGGRMDWDHGTSWGMVIAMIVLAVVVVGAFVWAIVYASRRGHAPASPVAAPTSAGPSARDLLDQRYARGEIDTADYEERRAKLG